MEDQVYKLSQRQIPACFLGSAQCDPSVHAKAAAGQYKVVYATPEFALSIAGLGLLEALRFKIVLFAVDECHCISSWGHEFRSSYRDLGNIRDKFPDIAFVAATATATQTVLTDVQKSLRLRNPVSIVECYNRPNLFFEVFLKSGIRLDLLPLLQNQEETPKTIVYCPTRNQAEEICNILRESNINALCYHAGKELAERKVVASEFRNNRISVVVATIAYGKFIIINEYVAIILGRFTYRPEVVVN